jgi:hypothetical protein
MPGMMPKQGAPTPQAMVGPLSQMHMQQLTQMMLNPRPEGPPLYAVLSAITEKQKQAQAQASMQRQMAMAQGQQAAQQPPIAQQVLAQAQQQAAQPRMGVEDYKRQAAALSDQGRHAEAMQLLELAKEQEHREFTRQEQDYAGGGAVAFQNGGFLGYNRDYEDARRLGIDLSPYDPPAVRAEKLERVKKMREFEKSMAANRADIPVDTSKLFPGGPPEVRMPIPEIEIAPPPPRPPGATRPGTGIAQGQNRPQAAAPAAAPTDTGLAGLMGPTVEPERLAMRGAVDERQAAIRNAAKTPEDVLKARGGIDALMKEIVDSRRAEEQRLMTHSDKRLEEARARAAQSPLNDISYLGQMLEGMRGSKRFGEALAGAASGAGRAQTARSQALQAAEDKYDLSRRDIFNLANLRQQVQLDQAKLAEARATGDADRANKAALDLAQSKEALAKFEADVSDKSRQFGLEERKLTQQGQIAREQMANALKVAGIGAAARESASDIAEKRFALQQLRADPEYTAAMNKIKELSKAAGMSNSPTVQAAFRAAQQEALAVAKRYGLAPQDIGAAAAPAASAENDPLGIRK